jgi:ATP-dependent Clp protease adaptor protein ClpS
MWFDMVWLDRFKTKIRIFQMPKTIVTDKPAGATADAVKLEDVYQVVLYNDEFNSMDFVIKCLMQLAAKIMVEAHYKGRAIAEVENEAEAKLHRDQLLSYGLTASIEKV